MRHYIPFYRDIASYPLQWRHSGRDGVSNHQRSDCMRDRLLRRRSQKTSKLRVTGLCVRNSPVTGEFPAQRASNAENVSIWWRHHAVLQPKISRISEMCFWHALCHVDIALFVKWLARPWHSDNPLLILIIYIDWGRLEWGSKAITKYISFASDMVNE